MKTIMEGRVGPAYALDGNENEGRLTRDSAWVVQEMHGRYTESVYRGGANANMKGGVFSAATGAAGVAPGTALGTAPPLALWNPLNSGVIVSLIDASLGYISGTLGAGTIVLAGGIAGQAQQTTTPSGGTALTSANNYLGGAAGAGKAFQGSTIAITPTVLRPVFTLGAYLATTAWPGIAVEVPLEGKIQIPPGGIVCLQGISAAGSTPLVSLGLTWEEFPA